VPQHQTTLKPFHTPVESTQQHESSTQTTQAEPNQKIKEVIFQSSFFLRSRSLGLVFGDFGVKNKQRDKFRLGIRKKEEKETLFSPARRRRRLKQAATAPDNCCWPDKTTDPHGWILERRERR